MLLLLLTWQVGQPLQAATLYWNLTGTSTWVTGANWSDNAVSAGTTGVVPGASDIAVFNQSSVNGATTATIAANTSVAGFIFNNTGTTGIRTDGTANRTFTIGTGGITINAGAGAVTFGTTTANQRIPITLGGSQTWLNNSSNTFSLNANNTIVTAGFTLTVDGTGNTTAGGIISGTGGIIKNGAGTLTLGNVVNTYTGGAVLNAGVLVINGANTMASGGVTVNGGTLRLGNDAALGATANTLTINGGIIDVSAARLTTNNNAQNWNGDFTFLGTNTWNTGTGNVAMNASRSVTVAASTMTVGGGISGVGFGLTKLGAGTLALAGANSYSGATTINGGTLSLGGNGTLLSTTGVTIANRFVVFTLDNTLTNLTNRVADAATISSSGGTINFTHGGAVSTNYAESVGVLTLNAGASTINASQAAASQTSAMTLASIARNAGGTLLYSGLGAGVDARNQLLLTSTTGLPASGAVIPWAVVTDGTASNTAFAIHSGDGTSLSRLATHNTGTPSTWVATDNARPSATAGTNNAAKSVNTITFDSGVDLSGTAATALSADRIITMSGAGGGAILQTGGTSSVTNNGTSSYQFAFGTNEALFHILGTLDIGTGSTADTNLTGSGGLTKSGAGTLIIRGTSTITGTYRLNEGILEARIAGSLGASQPLLMNGGMLRLSNDANTTLTPLITLNQDSTIEISRVTAAATATTHTVGALTMGSGLTLTVNPNTTQISGGATAFGLTTGALTLNGPAIFNVSNNGTGTGTLTVGTIAGAFTITKTGAGNLVTNSIVSGYTAPVSILSGNAGWSNASATITETQIFSGAGGIIKSGAGTVNLTSANTFTGGVTTTGGVLQYTSVGNNGSATATNLGQGTNGITLSGGTLSFIGSTSQSTNRGGTVNASTSLSADGTGGATITYAGAFTAPGTDVTTTLTGSGDGLITGSFVASSGTGDTTKTGTGTWTWSGSGSTGDDLLINAGRLVLTGSQKTVTDDTIVTGATAILDLNATGVINGASSTSAGLYARTGGTINLNADDAYNSSNGLDFILLGDNSTGGATLNTNTFNITTPRLDVGQDSTGFVGSITGSGTVTVGTSAHLFQGNLVSTASLLGAGSIYKLGGGTFTLSGVASGMTSATGPEIHSGILELDYTTNNAAKFAANTSVNMSGGTLLISGNASADTLVTLLDLNLTTGTTTGSFPTLTGGSSVINLTAGGLQSVALSFGNILHALGGSTIRFNLPAGTQSATHGFVTTQANTNGIIGGYATVFDGTSTNFATNSGGNIVAITPTSQNDVTLWTTAQNITDSSGFTGTLSANTNITSLRFNAVAASTVTIASGVILNLSSGGVLQTVNAGGISTISGGRLQSGAGSELIFHVDSATQRLEVTSQITGSASVTKGGIGTLRLNSANNFYSGTTSVLGGVLQVSGGNAIGDHSDLIVGGGQTSTFELLADEVIGNLTLGGENGSTAGVGVVSSINLGSSKLTFNQETAITMVGVLFTSGTGGTLVKSGSATWTNAANNPGFAGTFQVDQGLVIFNANVSQLSAATAVTLNGSGSSLRLDADQTTANNRILNTATITLNNTAGITANALGFYQRRNGGSNTGNEVVGQLVLGAGHNTIAADGTGTGRIGTITFTNATSLMRNNLATLLVLGRGLGDTAVTIRGNVAFSTEPGGAIGGGGAGGTTTTSIYPYVVGETTAGAPSGSVNFGNSFVRINSLAAGFKPLLTSEYINDSAAPATGTNNVRYTATNAITTPAAINSLVLDSGTAIALSGSATSMEITSGAILAAGTGAHSIGTISGLTTGSSGANPYYVYVTNPAGSLTLTSPLTSAIQLVKSGAGSLILGTTGNLFTDLHFNMGVVQADAQNKLGTGALRFFGGTLQFNAAFDASVQADLSTAKTIFLGTGGGTFDTGIFNVSLANAIGGGGAGGLTKIGTGSLTLLSPSAYSGGTAVQNGTLILASGANDRLPTTTALILGSGATSGVLQLGNGSGASNNTVAELSNSGGGGAGNKIVGGDNAVSVLTINQATQTDFSGSIGGVGTNENNIGITKSGVGSLTLSGTTLSFAGPLSVTAGDLNITGSIGALLAPSALTVNAGATLNLLNGVGQVINLGSGGLSLGTGTGPAILGLELGSTSAYDHIITTGAATTTGSVLINLTNLTGFGAGNYDLLKADAGGLSGATYTLGAAALGGVSLSLVPTDTLVQLQVSAIVGDLYWKGAVGAGWTAFNGANSNFTTDLAGNNNAFGIPGTNNGVIFSANSQTNTAINTTLNANFFIRDLTFNNNLGSGPLDTISIAEGSGGSLTITPTVSTAGINLQTGAVGNVIISAPVVLGASQTWTVADAATVLASSGGISGTANLIKAGSGILALAGSNTYVGTTTVNGGVLRASSANAFNATSAHTIGVAGTLRLNGFAQTLSSLTGAVGSILENGAASGNVVLTVGGSSSTTFAGTIQNGGTATLGLTKIGTGTLTLSGNSPSPTGIISINGGILAITGTTNNGVGALGTTSLGSSAGTQGLLYVPVGGSYTTTSLTVGGNATGVGSLVINGGTVTTTTPTISVGLTMGGGGYGGLFISNGGSLTTHRLENSSGAATSVSVIQLSGGTLTADDYLIFRNNRWELTVTGGNLVHNTGINNIALGYSGTSTFGVMTVAGGLVDNSTRNISFGQAAGSITASLNLNSGTLLTNAITSANGAVSYVNFNGGTLKVAAASTTFLPTGVTAAYSNGAFGSYAGGAVVDTNGFNVTFVEPILSPVGTDGVSGLSVSTAGTGYIGAPYVEITGGGGTGATGYAVVDLDPASGTFGQVISVVLTNPGVGYTSAPTVSLIGGGGTGAVVTAAGTVANTSGGLTKTGLGILTLSGANTYTGGTTVNLGTLVLGASGVLADTGNVTINGGTFDVAGFGETVAAVSLLGGTITGTTGVLTSTTDYDLRSGTVDFTGSGGLSGTGNVTKTTLGTVTLLNNGLGGNFSKVVNVNGGTLEFSVGNQLGDASATNTIGINGGKLSLITPTTVSLGATRTVAVGTAGATLDTSFALSAMNITGGITTAAAGNLTKTGAGTVTVTGTTNLNGGVVTVSGGTLNAGFSASGIGGVTVANGGTLNLYDGSAVTAAITSLSLVSGSALGFDLNAPGTNDVLALTINAPVLSGTITVNLNNLEGLGVGTYDLITSALGGLNGAAYMLGTAPSGPNYSFATVSGDTILRLTVSALTLRYWQGDQDGSWATNNAGNTNWATDENGGVDAGALPAFTDTLVFSTTNAPFTTGSVINTLLDGSRTADSLRFLAAPVGVTAFTIAPGSGGTLTLTPVSSNNGISVADNAGAVTISAQIATGATQTWEVIGTGVNGSSLTISGGVTFNNSVTKTGAGSLTLSGSNSGAGGLTINAGTLNLGSSSAPGTGTLTLGPGITLDNSSGSPLTLSNNNALTVNGSFSFTGTNALDLGTGGLTLGINAIVQVVNSTLTEGGAIGDGGNAWSLGKAGSGTLVLNGANTYDGLTNVLQGTLTLAGNNVAAGGGVTTATGTTLNINNNNALGTGTLSIGAGAIIDNTLGSLVTNAGNNLQTWNGNFSFTGSNNLNLGTGTVTLGSTATVTTSGAATTLTVGGVIDDGVNIFNLTKDGAGTLTLSGLSATAANNYSGTTILNGGTLAITNTAALAGALNFGTAAGTNLSTLDLSAGSLTIGGTTTVQTNSTSANSITIGNGQTLRLNGTVMVGAAGNTTTVLNTTGAGTLTIGAAGEATNLNVSLGGNVTTNVSNGATWDMSGLSTFYANVGTGTFRVGDLTNSGGTATKGSTLTLAADSTILATTLVVASPDSGVTEVLKLGSGTNIINATTINIGGDSTNRSSGSLSFNTGTGTLKIRSLADPVSGRATLNVANIGNSTGANPIGTFDTTGHTADLLLGTLTVASRTAANNGSATGTFSFDTGTLNADNLLVGNKAAGTTGGNATGTVTLAGTGATTINNTSGPVQLGVNGSSNGTSSGTLNVTGGTVNVAASGGIAIRLGQATAAGGTATGLVDISGGTLTVAGDIIRGATAGTSTATITLHGGILDVGGNTIGSAVNQVALIAESGTLKNLFRFNGGGTLTKTTAGTLILEGTNSYAGTTLISGGVLQIGGGTLGTGSSTGTLGSGGVTNNATLTFNRSNSYTVGNLISGTGAVIQAGAGTTVLTNANTYSGTTTISAGTLQLGDGTNGKDGTIGNSLSIVNDAALVYNRFAISGLTYGGVISGTGTVTKTGAGTQILTGANTYSGGTSVDGGTLEVNNILGSGTGSGSVIVNSGATLSGSGSIAGSMILNSGAVLAPGTGADATLQLTFTAVNTAVEVKDGGQIQLGLTSSSQIDSGFNWTMTTALSHLNNLTSDGTDFTTNTDYTTYWKNAESTYDSIKLTNGSFNLGETAGGTIKLLDNTATYTIGNIFKLLDWSTVGTADSLLVGSGGFTLSNLNLDSVALGSGLAWDTSAFTTYGVIVVVPEPSRALFLMLGLLSLMLRRRRR